MSHDVEHLLQNLKRRHPSVDEQYLLRLAEELIAIWIKQIDVGAQEQVDVERRLLPLD
jgi:hypothetical protein